MLSMLTRTIGYGTTLLLEVRALSHGENRPRIIESILILCFLCLFVFPAWIHCRLFFRRIRGKDNVQKQPRAHYSNVVQRGRYAKKSSQVSAWMVIVLLRVQKVMVLWVFIAHTDTSTRDSLQLHVRHSRLHVVLPSRTKPAQSWLCSRMTFGRAHWREPCSGCKRNWCVALFPLAQSCRCIFICHGQW